MKRKQLRLTIICVLLFGAATLIFSQIILHNKQDHWAFMNRLSTIGETHASLNEAILRSKNFESTNYDQIVTHSQQLRDLLQKSSLSVSPDVKATLERLKSETQKMLEAVEKFKSKNAVLKNSNLYFIQLRLELIPLELGERNLQLARALNKIKTSASSYLFSSKAADFDQAQLHLQQTLARKDLSTEVTGILSAILSHLRIIKETRVAVNALVHSISSERPREIMRELKLTYLKSYNQLKRTVVVYETILFAMTILLMGYIIFILTKLWLTNDQLHQLNTTLESRVEERTRDLEQSMKIIHKQQQTLVSSSKMSALGEMAGGIAHEINNPLAIMALNCNFLKKSLDKQNYEIIKEAGCVDNLIHTTERIAKIVKGLRTFSREGSLDGFESYNMRRLIDETLILCEQKFRTHGIEITINCDPRLEVDCQCVALSQVLLNLLSNASDAIWNLEAKWIRIDARVVGENFELAVTDSGAGIPKDIQNKIMQPFFTTKEIGKGTGMGLSISKGLIEGHSGSLDYNQTGANTRFVITIPVRRKRASA